MMALTAPASEHPSWGRWQQPMPQEYNMMDTQGMMVYNSRPHSPAMVPSQLMAPQFMMPQGYGPSPVQSVHAQYHSSPYDNFHGHSPLLAPPMACKQDYSDSVDARAHAPSMVRQDVKPTLLGGYVSPPLSRRGSSISLENAIPNPTLTSKTITANKTLNPQDRIDFDTNVDQLMKALQTSDSAGDISQAVTPMTSPRMDHLSSRSSPMSSMASPAPSAHSSNSSKPKTHFCNGPGCNKSFSQKTHLEIHKRTHTGDRPYVCKHEGCNLTFSQLGNLKTHERRHTGERPYKCSKCPKTFAQKGNVKSHEETHEGKKPFKCILELEQDGRKCGEICGKNFSQLGNMKTHQNTFHQVALQELTANAVKFAAQGYTPPEYREVMEYFKMHYKNSNKGIKGRGKARKIAGSQAKSTPRKAVSSKTVETTTQRTPEPVYTTSSTPREVSGAIPRTGDFSPVYNVESHSPNDNMLYAAGHIRQVPYSGHMY